MAHGWHPTLFRRITIGRPLAASPIDAMGDIIGLASSVAPACPANEGTLVKGNGNKQGNGGGCRLG